MSKKRTLRTLANEILSLAEKKKTSPLGRALHEVDNDPVLLDSTTISEWRRNISAIKKGDVWFEMCPFVLASIAGGWEFADGDPICNWAGNTFIKTYPLDVKASTIVRRMEKWCKEDNEQQAAEKKRLAAKKRILKKLTNKEIEILGIRI